MADATAEAPADVEDKAQAPAEAAAPEKSKKEKKKKEKKGDASSEQAAAGAPSIAAHPRAARSIARAKGWAALAGFLLGGYESLPTHTLAAAGVRAIVFGVVLYVAVWAGSVFFWRRMVIVEIRAREQQLIAAVQARREAAPNRGGGA